MKISSASTIIATTTAAALPDVTTDWNVQLFMLQPQGGDVYIGNSSAQPLVVKDGATLTMPMESENLFIRSASGSVTVALLGFAK